MIHWAWLIPAMMISGSFGVLMMAVIAGGKDGE